MDHPEPGRARSRSLRQITVIPRAPANGYVYAGSNDGSVYALRSGSLVPISQP